jgi:hypothetical protein
MMKTALSDPIERTGVTQLFKKPTFLKIPAVMIMLRRNDGHISRLMYDVDIVNYNGNGVCIRWNYCALCFGYEPSSIHDKCYFKQFDITNPHGNELHFNIEVQYKGELFSFRGKAVSAYKTNRGEKISIKFTEISEKTRAYLEHYFCRK